MKSGKFHIHLAVAAAISFGISFFAWSALGVFETIPFWTVSISITLVASFAGWISGRRLAVTATVAFLARAAFLAAAVSG